MNWGWLGIFRPNWSKTPVRNCWVCPWSRVTEVGVSLTEVAVATTVAVAEVVTE